MTVLPSKSVIWGGTIKFLITSVLSVPLSSASCERCFSYLKWRKYDRRSRLSPSNLDHLLRIHVNGPPPDEFDSYKYAESWHKNHYLSDRGMGSVGAKERQKEEEDVIKEFEERKARESMNAENFFMEGIMIEETLTTVPLHDLDKEDPDIPPIF